MLTDRLRVLDPLCGRGTTLNQALMYGWHAAGVDVDERDFDAYAAFLPRWLKDKRLKHTRRHRAGSARDGRTLGRRFDAELAVDKEAWAAGDTITGRASLQADTRETADRAQGRERRRDRHRRAVRRAARQPVGRRVCAAARSTCCAEALPGWVDGAPAGGAVAIAVNVRTCPRAQTCWRCSPRPAWSRSTTRRTAASSTASTRRSSATSWSASSPDP